MCCHHTHQGMVRRASHGRPWPSEGRKNRAVPTQVHCMMSNTKGTVSHAPETESRRVTQPAPGIGIQDPSTQWQTPTSIHFWKANNLLREIETADCSCRVTSAKRYSHRLLSSCLRYPTFLSEVVPSPFTCQTLCAVHRGPLRWCHGSTT